MTAVVVPGLYLLSGICAYAGIAHLIVAVDNPRQHLHLVFAGMCLLAITLALTHAEALQATDIRSYVAALKWSLAAAFLFLMVFPWFIAGYTGVNRRPLLLAANAPFVVLFVANIALPYGIQYESIDGLRSMVLPWGEVITQASGRNSAWTIVAVAGVVALFAYALVCLVLYYRRGRSSAALAMILAVGALAVASGHGVLVRLGLIDSFPMGMFGFLAMVVAMSVALNSETRARQRESERRFRSMVEQSPFSIQVLAPNGMTQQVNAAWERLWGVTAADLARYNILQDRQLIEKGAMPGIRRAFAGEAAEIPPIVYNPAENPLVAGPARNRWVRAFAYPLKDETGLVRDVVLMHEDVTDSKRVGDAIRQIAAGVSAETGERFFQQLVLSLTRLFNADFALIGVIDDHDPQRVNTLTLCAHGAIVPNISYALHGTPCANVLGRSTCAYPRGVQALFPADALLADMGVEGYIGTPLFDAAGGPLGLIVVLNSKPLAHVEQTQEILEIFAARASAELQRIQAEAHIHRMAYQDHLTGFASRAHLHERLATAVANLRDADTTGALLLIDLDHFKTINDALGHDVGDEVLRAVAGRLRATVGDCAFLARLGGDEFVALLGSPCDQNVALDLARRIIDKLLSPIFIGERALSIGASIGVALFPEQHETDHDVLRRADMALYRAKGLGRGNIQLYQPGLQTAADNRLRLEAGLRQAMENGEFELHFQPQVDADGGLLGAEALLRWHHPELGDISPVEFIPVAEETGLIHGIGGWVFEQACLRIADWSRSAPAFTGCLSVNVCPWQFSRPDFLKLIRDTLDKHRIDPGRFMLEVTESALLIDLAETIEKLSALRAIGIRTSLDDFGTGYSSLAHLRDLPLDELKIDKSFVAEIDGTREHPLVESMIAIGHHMNLDVIAEGVETETQRAALIGLGCNRFQGYLFARPMPEGEFLRWLSTRP